MIAHDARWSLSLGNNLVQSPWQATVHFWVIGVHLPCRREQARQRGRMNPAPGHRPLLREPTHQQLCPLAARLGM
jgi:hypothetical protein